MPSAPLMRNSKVWKACAIIGVGVAFGGLSWWTFDSADSSPLASGLFALMALAAFVLPARSAVSALRAKPAAPEHVLPGGPYRAADKTSMDRDPPSAELDAEGPADGVDHEDHGDGQAAPVHPASVRDSVNDALARIRLVKVVCICVPMWWIGAMFVLISTGFRIFGDPLIDCTILALAPWGMGFAALKWVETVRGERFGQEHARVGWSATGAILTVGGASLGLVLVIGFIPRAVSTHAPMDIVLALVGPLLCALPVIAIRRSLKEP